jgi:uncharacterized small protein (DUF1192 family)
LKTGNTGRRLAPGRTAQISFYPGFDAGAILDGKEGDMPAADDDDRPKKKLAHEIGQDLALLSVEELSERLALLREEIVRLEAARTQKQVSRSAADQFFRR